MRENRKLSGFTSSVLSLHKFYADRDSTQLSLSHLHIPKTFTSGISFQFPIVPPHELDIFCYSIY